VCNAQHVTRRVIVTIVPHARPPKSAACQPRGVACHRTIEGFAEWMIFRAFYPRGLTALDDFNEVSLGTWPTMSHATARREVANLLNSTNLGSLSQPVAAQTPGDAAAESDRDAA